MGDVNIRNLSAGDFSPFGKIIQAQQSCPVFESDEMVYWGNIALSEKIISVGFLRVFQRNRELTELEQHSDSFELMTVLDGEVLLPVSADLKEIAVFHMVCGDSVIIRPGIWHYHPAATNGESASLQIVFNEGTETADRKIMSLEKIIYF